ncbi:uncharacterized protein ASCRUDRAFT_18667, partial [Ascoidea rubescens DSM 1968]
VFNGEFNEAYQYSKSNLKFLLLILYNNKFYSNLFLQNIFFKNSNNLFSLIQNHGDNFIVWGGNTNYLESFLIGNTYKAKFLPFVALIGNVSTFNNTFPTMSIIYKEN